MAKFFLVFKHEFLITVTRKSFFLVILLVPIISFAVLGIGNYFNQGNEISDPVSEILTPTEKKTYQGLVDQSGIVQKIPPEYKESIIFYQDSQTAEKALTSGKITGYFLISKDFLKTNQIIYSRSDFNPLRGLEQSDNIQYIINYNLLPDEPALVDRISSPIQLETQTLTKKPQRDPGNMLSFFIPYVITIWFSGVLMSVSSLMLNSIGREKQSRVLELLLTSLSPAQLITGKLCALGLVGLFQVFFWGSFSLLMLNFSQGIFKLSSTFQISPEIIVWAAIFFICGYVLYSSLMSAVGILAPDIRDTSVVTMLISSPLFIPFMFLSMLINEPNSTISTVLSLIPFTAPVAMMTRLSASSSVPFWQLALSVSFLIITAILANLSVTRLFRTQLLLSGQPFNLLRFIKGLLGQV
jgi:ABC-2 type transport system permease protein